MTPAAPPPLADAVGLGPTRVIILCGGMGKRMRQKTHGRISKVELPIPLPPTPDGQTTSETLLGMLVRVLAGLPSLDGILLLTSDKWLTSHARLAAGLAARYRVDVRCRSDNGTGDEFPPSALADLCEQIGQHVDSGHATILLNGDVLFGPHGLAGFVDGILGKAPRIAMGAADGLDYLGLFFFARDLHWRQLIREIAPKTTSDLLGGLWQRVPIETVTIDGPVYDCGSVEGYRAACEAGRSGALW